MTKTKIVALSALALVSFVSVSMAGNLSFVSSTDTLIKNCPNTIDIMMNTEGAETTVIEAVVSLNDQYDFNGFDATQGVLKTYTNPKKLTNGNYMKVLGTTASTAGFKGEGKFGTLTITPRADTVNLELFMKPKFNGADSNMFLADGSDALTSVGNKTFKALEGTCPVAPQVPADLQTSDDLPKTITTSDLGDILKEVTSKNEGIILPTTVKVPMYLIYIGIGLILAILVAVLMKKKNTNK